MGPGRHEVSDAEHHGGAGGSHGEHSRRHGSPPISTDLHVHCFDPSLVPDEVHRAKVEAFLGRTGRNGAVPDLVERSKRNMDDRSGDLLRRELETSGFDHALLVGIDWGLVGEPVPETSPERWLEWAGEVVDRHRGFFSFAFSVDPRRDGAGGLARRALERPWVRGLKLYPPAGFSPADEVCSPLYEAALDAGAFVVAHTGGQSYPFDLAGGRLEPYSTVQRRYPGLRLVLAHAGYPMWARHAVEVARGHAGTSLEVSGWHHAVEEEPDELERFLASAWRELGPDRVLFGSDFLSGPRSVGTGSARIGAWRDAFRQQAERCGIDVARSEAAARALLRRDGP